MHNEENLLLSLLILLFLFLLFMYISLEWLKDYVDMPDDISPQVLENKITTSTAEVESYQMLGQDKIVVGKVLTSEKHPNADKLTLVTVSLGKEEWRVVCGGTNVREGMLVAFAQEGAKVKWHGEGEEIVLEKATIRGVESRGMICASNEIGIPIPCSDHEIADLTSYVSEKDIGKNVYDVLALRDLVLEIDNKSLTNRPDLLGHYGIAREITAIFKTQDKKKMKLKPYPQIKRAFGKEDLNITIQSNQCRRYSALKIAGIRVEPSPIWMQKRLERVGIRPINNIVDITNFVMMDLGQPLHAFDATCIAGEQIIVRQAKKGEKILALDGKNYDLNTSDLVIADQGKPVALAGIMGGEHFSINANTTSVIFESANFDPTTIRKTAQRLSLRSESSSRFEKNLDPEYTIQALLRAVGLLLDMNKKASMVSTLFDIYPTPIPQPTISVRPHRVNQKIGVAIPVTSMKNILTDLGCIIKKGTAKSIDVLVPSWRATKDLLMEDDLIEEIARIYGYNKIPLTAPEGALIPSHNEEKHIEQTIRNIFVQRLNAFEVRNYPFTNRKEQERFGLPTKHLLALKNFLSSDDTHLKTTLAIDLLQDAKENIHMQEQFRLFELGRIFIDHSDRIEEEKKIGGIFVSPLHTENNFFTSKEALEIFLHLISIQGQSYIPFGDLIFLDKGQAAKIMIQDQMLGWIGSLHDSYKKEFDLENSSVTLFEIDQALLGQAHRIEPSFSPLPKFPPVIRDLAIVIDKKTPSSLVEQTIRSAHPTVQYVDLFDIYEGEHIGNDQRSLAYNITYLDPNKTLAPQDIEEITKTILSSLHKIGGNLRS